MSDSPARVAADVAAMYPMDHPVARIARDRLAEEARSQTMATQIGSSLRDAAVDPRPGDFMAPVNAGKPGEEGNPHGPHVRSYEVGSPQYQAEVDRIREQQAGAGE